MAWSFRPSPWPRRLDGVEVHEGPRNNLTHQWLISTQGGTAAARFRRDNSASSRAAKGRRGRVERAFDGGGSTQAAHSAHFSMTRSLCGNQMSRRISSHGPIMTFTPSTRRLLDGVVVSIPHRSTEPAQPRHRAPDSLVDFHTGYNESPGAST